MQLRWHPEPLPPKRSPPFRARASSAAARAADAQPTQVRCYHQANSTRGKHSESDIGLLLDCNIQL
eukprot:194110-Chlamydomonas_euryale.AAC.2